MQNGRSRVGKYVLCESPKVCMGCKKKKAQSSCHSETSPFLLSSLGLPGVTFDLPDLFLLLSKCKRATAGSFEFFIADDDDVNGSDI